MTQPPNKDKAAREFWLAKHPFNEELLLVQESTKPSVGWLTDRYIHVVEQSALTAVKEELEAVRRELQEYKMPPFTSAGQAIRHYQKELATTKARLEKAVEQRNSYIYGYDKEKNALTDALIARHNEELAIIGAEKKESGI